MHAIKLKSIKSASREKLTPDVVNSIMEPRCRYRTATFLQVVEENKRQMCVYSLLSEKKEGWKWWDYVSGFATECTMANGRFADRSCIRAQLEKTGLQESAVDSCMGDSTTDATHDLLQVCS